MDEVKLMKTMRQMAWNRAKGELLSMLDTYWPYWTADNKKIENGFEETDKRIREFIADFESNCL